MGPGGPRVPYILGFQVFRGPGGPESPGNGSHFSIILFSYSSFDNIQINIHLSV